MIVFVLRVHYPKNIMNTYIQPHPNNCLVVGPRSIRLTMMICIARLAERGPVRVLDNGLQFDCYLISNLLRGRANMREQISLSHASTCRQVLDWFEKADALPAPYVMLDFLHPFYNSAISFEERCRLLRCCIWHLDRLSQVAGGVISVNPPESPSSEADQLLSIMKSSTQSVWVQRLPFPFLRPEPYQSLN